MSIFLLPEMPERKLWKYSSKLAIFLHISRVICYFEHLKYSLDNLEINWGAPPPCTPSSLTSFSWSPPSFITVLLWVDPPFSKSWIRPCSPRDHKVAAVILFQKISTISLNLKIIFNINRFDYNTFLSFILKSENLMFLKERNTRKKIHFSNPYIWATWFRRPLKFQVINSARSNIVSSLKY